MLIATALLVAFFFLGSRLGGRIGSRPTGVAGLAVTAAGTVPLTRLTESGSVYAGLLPGVVIASLGIGAVFVTATTAALAMVEHREAGVASGVVNTFHEVGGSIGVDGGVVLDVLDGPLAR
ncbi:MFS transporter [Streptomyces lincolnensis]|uniref:MFS transporter n=1 Tax=Streptomyces lincolnensis TaxID=1915 RepID=UPI0037CDC82B